MEKFIIFLLFVTEDALLRKYTFFTTVELAQIMIRLSDHHSQLLPFCMTCKEHCQPGDVVVTSCLHTFCSSCAPETKYCSSCSKFTNFTFARLDNGERVLFQPQLERNIADMPLADKPTGPLTLEHMPRDILIHIFSFLCPNDLVTIEKVCRKFSSFHGTPSIPEEAARKACVYLCREGCALMHNSHHHHTIPWKKRFMSELGVSLTVINGNHRETLQSTLHRVYFTSSRQFEVSFPSLPSMAGFTSEA